MQIQMIEILKSYEKRTRGFQHDAHEILAKHESSPSRIITIDATRKRLSSLSIRQDELFQQALRCVESGVHRAAHVMAWAAFIDCLEEIIASDGLIKVRQKRPDWTKHKDIDSLREYVPEYQLIEVARDIGLFSKSECKTILGLLSKRNECAHPSHYSPGLNESLGYISELLNRVARLAVKPF